MSFMRAIYMRVSMRANMRAKEFYSKYENGMRVCNRARTRAIVIKYEIAGMRVCMKTSMIICMKSSMRNSMRKNMRAKDFYSKYE